VPHWFIVATDFGDSLLGTTYWIGISGGDADVAMAMVIVIVIVGEGDDRNRSEFSVDGRT